MSTGDMRDDVLASREAGGQALRGGILRAAGYSGGIALSLVSAPILIRHLGIEDFGRYTTVLAVVAVVGGFTEAGVNMVATREAAARAGADRASVLAGLFGIRVLVTTAGAAIAIGFAAAAGYGSDLIVGTALAAVALLVASTQAFLAVGLQAELRFGWATAVELVRQAVTTALIVALAIAGAALVPFFAVQILAGAVAVALTVPLVRRSMPLRPSFRLRAAWPLLRQTIPFAIATALYATYFRIGIIVMSLISTEEETGYYATSFRIMEVLIMVPLLVISAAFPLLARAATDDEARFVGASRRIVELSFTAGVACALAVALIAPFAIAVLAGAEGEPSVPVLRIHAVALAASFVAVACGLTLLALHRERAVLAANAAALVVALPGTFALVPVLDAQGAALATALGEWTLALVSGWALARAQPDLRGALRVVPAVLAAGLAGAAILLVPDVSTAVAFPAGLATFLLVLKLLGQFPPEVREALDVRRRGRAG